MDYRTRRAARPRVARAHIRRRLVAELADGPQDGGDEVGLLRVRHAQQQLLLELQQHAPRVCNGRHATDDTQQMTRNRRIIVTINGPRTSRSFSVIGLNSGPAFRCLPSGGGGLLQAFERFLHTCRHGAQRSGDADCQMQPRPA